VLLLVEMEALEETKVTMVTQEEMELQEETV
jgi:hypothetical protein